MDRVNNRLPFADEAVVISVNVTNANAGGRRRKFSENWFAVAGLGNHNRGVGDALYIVYAWQVCELNPSG